MDTIDTAPAVSGTRLPFLALAGLLAAGCAQVSPPAASSDALTSAKSVRLGDSDETIEQRRAREQLKAARDRIQAEAGIREHAPGQVPHEDSP